MRQYMVFIVGAILGMVVLMLLSGDGAEITVHLPEIYWTLETMKYVLSLFVATVVMITIFWYYA